MDIESLLEGTQDEGRVVDYQYFNLLKNRSILFNDECSEDIIERVGIPLLNFEKDDSNAPVNLYINSQGGEVFSSLFLCNIIDNYKKKLNIHILGYALSMGGVLACAGANNPNVTKDCYPFSIGMLHAGSISVSGTSGQSKSFMKFNDKIEAKTKSYILSHTHISEEEYDAKNDEDWWLTAEDLLNLGIVDKIIGEPISEKA